MAKYTISPLRQRMIDAMTLRKLSDKTQLSYIRAVKRLAQFLQRSPDTANAEDLRLFQMHLVEQGVSSQTINATLTGLRFFFTITLDRPRALRHTSSVPTPEKLPRVNQQIYEPHFSGNGNATQFSDGWVLIGLESTPRVLFFGGSYPGTTAILAIYPDNDMVVSLVTNTWGKNGSNWTFSVLNQIGAIIVAE